MALPHPEDPVIQQRQHVNALGSLEFPWVAASHAAAIWVGVMPWQGVLKVPTSGGEKEQPSCVDSQGAAAAVVHESAVALIELFATQLTGSPALSYSTDI